MKRKKKMTAFIIILSVVLVLCIGVFVSGLFCNNALELNTINVTSDDLPKSFDGFRVAHISDLHNKDFGNNNEKLLHTIRESKPDIIAITGDIIDSRETDVEIALNFVQEAVKIAPCYYVSGNHEARLPQAFNELLSGFEDAGVIVLRNESIQLSKGNEHITLLGVEDPDFTFLSNFTYQGEIADKALKEIAPKDTEEFTLLLSHRPELFQIYKNNYIDLTLSGHAHGGQFRLPFIGGLYAPHQGLLPEYDNGLYSENGSNLIVSRGIGNSLFPLRLFNPPEVILIELSLS